MPGEILVWRPDYIVYYRKSYFPNKVLNDSERRSLLTEILRNSILSVALPAAKGGEGEEVGERGILHELSTKIDDFFAGDERYGIFVFPIDTMCV